MEVDLQTAAGEEYRPSRFLRRNDAQRLETITPGDGGGDELERQFAERSADATARPAAEGEVGASGTSSSRVCCSVRASPSFPSSRASTVRQSDPPVERSRLRARILP